MSRRAILLHIGAPKSGSTFLQRALLANAGRLAAAGIAYPHDGGPHPGNAAGAGMLDAAALAALFGDARRLVLSHEDLFALTDPATAAPLARAAAALGASVAIVAFLRPWGEFCFADYAQHLRQNLDRYIAARDPFDGAGLEAMAARRAREIDPARYLANWRRVFPAAPVTLAPHTAIPATVERLLGAPGLDWTVPQAAANPSLHLADCEAIAALIRDPAVPAAAIRAALAAAEGRAVPPDPARTAERVARLDALFAAQNAALLAGWGYDNRARPGAAARGGLAA